MTNPTKDTFVVSGLDGKKTLNGEIFVNGAKNDALKAIAATVLFDDAVTLKNVPQTEDIKKMYALLESIGAKVSFSKKDSHSVTIDASGLTEKSLAGFDMNIAQSMRASIVLTGPLLAKYGKVKFPVPGGCVIGARPIDLFIEGYKKMGSTVDVDEKGETYVISTGKAALVGADIFFNVQTVGGTETLMMAAVLAKGKTTLKNCAMEPEIVSLAKYLVKCGADIKGIGTPTLEIVGKGGKGAGGSKVAGLLSKGKVYTAIPDRLEAGSFLLLGALCADNLKIKKCNPEHVEVLINMLRNSGVEITTGSSSIELKNNAKIKNSTLKPVNVKTHEYPGFPTDLQAPMMTYLTQVGGESTIFETIYEGRFKFIQNLERLGAGVVVMNPREVLIKGNKKESVQLKAIPAGETLDAFDIRAGFATIFAALLAKGSCVIENAYFVDRGYEQIETRLAALGAPIRRVHGDTNGL